MRFDKCVRCVLCKSILVLTNIHIYFKINNKEAFLRNRWGSKFVASCRAANLLKNGACGIAWWSKSVCLEEKEKAVAAQLTTEKRFSGRRKGSCGTPSGRKICLWGEETPAARPMAEKACFGEETAPAACLTAETQQAPVPLASEAVWPASGRDPTAFPPRAPRVSPLGYQRRRAPDH